MTPAGEIRLSVAGRSDPGRVRTENQDHMLVANLADEHAGGRLGAESREDFVLTERGAIVLVADGVGGHQDGAAASRIAAERVHAHMLEGDSPSNAAGDFVRRLSGALDRANTAVHAEARKEDGPRGMATTATLVGLLGSCAYAAQIGDSRAYLIRQGTIAQLTRDQSLVQDLIDSGILSEEDSHAVSDNTILQALGPAPRVRVAVTWHDLRRGDVLLLCSDGLSKVVSDNEICDTVQSTSDTSALCDTLVELANSRGGPDNVTVVVARFDGTGMEEPHNDGLIARQPFQA